MSRYEGAEWMQRQLTALNKFNPRKNPDRKLSALGVKVADFLGEWQFGIYHLHQKELFKVDWCSNQYIEISMYSSAMSTFDFNDLTRLVFLAHEMALRVQISPSTHNHIRIIFHERTHGPGDGNILHHPTLDEAINLFRQTYP